MRRGVAQPSLEKRRGQPDLRGEERNALAFLIPNEVRDLLPRSESPTTATRTSQ